VNIPLTAFLLRAHGPQAWPAPGTPIEWRPDHVLLDDADGTVAALAFEASGATRVACEVVLMAPQREAAGPDGLEDLRFLHSFANAAGAHFARPGAGPAGALHRRRFAAPGRVLASAVPGASAAGALGMLALPACALECAAAMAGEPLLIPRPRVAGVELAGVCDPGVSAIDVLAAVERRLTGEGVGAVLEFYGVGLLSLTMADRLSMAARASGVVGALSAIFPSDDRTRGWMRARGRDADWRRLEAAQQGFDTHVSLDLSLVRPVRAEGPRVRVAPYVEDEDVLGLARCVAHSGLRPGVSLEIVVPGRASLSVWTEAGALEALERAGATILDRSAPTAGAVAADAALLGGDPVDDTARERGVWACAARLVGSTPAEAMVSAGAAGPRALPPLDEVLEPEGGEIEHGSHHAQASEPSPHDAPLRLIVVLEAGEDAAASRLLPWGPRAWAARADAQELAGSLFRAIDPEAPARARAAGATAVVAGEGYGGGRHSEAVARATAALGVRAVIASSYAGGHDRLLALHGVLPLTWLEPTDRREVRTGDELEVPPPAAHAGFGTRVSVRHLTRGFTFDVRCDLELPLRELARAGGLLRAMREARAEPSR